MSLRKFTVLAALLIWCSFLFYMSCSSETDPGPVDCTKSNLEITTVSTNPSSCSVSDGKITATVSGGNQPYQYALDAQSFGSSSEFTGLQAGTYVVKVKDKNGCERSKSVILQPFGSNLAATIELDESGCKTNSGSITINATGGTGPYTYTINGGTATSNNVFSLLGTGNYTVRVIDNSGCSITQNAKVLSGVKLSTTIKNIIDTNCAVSNCHVSGGAAPISFTSNANIISVASGIKSSTQSGAMPKNGSKLSQTDLDAIACWVDDGAPNN